MYIKGVYTLAPRMEVNETLITRTCSSLGSVNGFTGFTSSSIRSERVRTGSALLLRLREIDGNNIAWVCAPEKFKRCSACSALQDGSAMCSLQVKHTDMKPKMFVLGIRTK
jgi:hypothetical protein